MEEQLSGEFSNQQSYPRKQLGLIIDNITGMPSALGMTDGYINSPTNGKANTSQQMNIETEQGYMNEETMKEGTLNNISKQQETNHIANNEGDNLISHTFYHSQKTLGL